VLIVLEMLVFSVFLARRAIVFSYGLKPVENGIPPPQSPRRGRQNHSTTRTTTRGNVVHQTKTIFRCGTLAVKRYDPKIAIGASRGDFGAAGGGEGQL